MSKVWVCESGGRKDTYPIWNQRRVLFPSEPEAIRCHRWHRLEKFPDSDRILRLCSSSRRNVEYKNKYELFQQQSRILGSRLSGLSCLAPDIQQAQQTTLTEAWLTSYLIGWERREVVISTFICQELARTVPQSPRSATRLLCACVRASVCKNARERKEFIQYRWIRSRKELSSF